jgi:signal transduction histidine kinase
MVVLSVHNTGSYIPPEILPRVFERFYRADSHRTRDGRHGGLGLSIAAEIVAAHGGRMQAASDPETGTEFRAYLPAPVETPAVDAAKQGRLAARLMSRPTPGRT